MFLISWSEMAQSKPISHKPSFRRSLLNPRRPSSYPPSIDEMYALISALAPPENPPPDERDKLISRIYYIESDQLRRLQSSAGERTKLETFTAFLWKLIAQKNRGNYKMGIVVDGRRRLLDGNVGDHIEKYFGNVLSIPFGERTAEELTDRPLSWVANWVHEFMEKGATKEHFLGLIDWVEVHRPKPALARIYGGSSGGGRSCVVSSGQRFPVEKVEFGWGKAAFGSYHFPWGGEAGYVMPMPSPKGNGDWVVYMHMFKGQLEFIENEAAHVFRPLTCDYLDLDV